MKRQGSAKIKNWTTKDYVLNILVFFINTVILGGVFLLVLYLKGVSHNVNVDIIGYLKELKSPIILLMFLAIISSIIFIFYYSFDRNYIRNPANSQMLFMIIEVSLIVNYVFCLCVNNNLRPVALIAILSSFLINKKSAFFNSFIFCLYVFLIDYFAGLINSPTDYIYLIVASASCVVGVLIVENAYSRIRILLNSLLISVYPVIGVGITLIIESEEPNITNIINKFCCAFSSGPLSVAIFMIILPFFETLFHKTTRFKLAELTDHKSKIIRRLIEEAPGTFNHCVAVSNIAESCATAIEEDALLARACAYYHDVGKLRHPNYFSENNTTGESPHDNLTPELSTNIIKSHTSDGYNLLEKHNFPREITSVCREHHGTMPILFFYEKAKKFTDGEVNILDYCYQGPKPQSKIAAIIMIADSSEASVRMLADHSREKVRKIVEKIVSDRTEMGQFDECDITLKELNIIINTVVNTLTGIYHSRVEYPKVVINKEQKEEVKEIKEVREETDG